MNAAQQGVVANVGGGSALLLPSLFQLVPPQYQAIVTAVLGIAGFAMNQYLLYKAQHQLPPGVSEATLIPAAPIPAPVSPDASGILKPAETPTAAPSSNSGYFLVGHGRALGLALFLMLLIFAIASCTNVTASQEIAAKSAIQLATIEAIKQGSNTADRAARVRSVVADARGIVTGDQTTTLDAIKAAVLAQLRMDQRTPEEQIAINNLIDLVNTELQARFGQGVLSPDQRVQIGSVLDWIVEATMAFPPEQPPAASLRPTSYALN